VDLPQGRRKSVVAAYIDEIIMAAVAIWMTGVGFGRFGSPFHPRPGQPQAWWTSFDKHFRWMGPLLLAIAVFLAVADPA
jgi:hypothetical protein